MEEVLNWLKNIAVPCITSILAKVGFEAAAVKLLPFGSVPSGYSIESSDVDIMVCIAGLNNTCTQAANNIEGLCINWLLLAVRQLSSRLDDTWLITEVAHEGTIKFTYAGVKVDLRTVVNAESGDNICSRSVQLMQKQLEQVECIRWHRKQYPHLEQVLPTIVWWAKRNKICHDGNAAYPGSISSLKACHWAYLVCSVAKTTVPTKTPLDALVATMKSLSELSWRSHHLRFEFNTVGCNAWEATWVPSTRRDGFSMQYILDGAYLPRDSTAVYLTVHMMESCLASGLSALTDSLSKFMPSSSVPPPPPGAPRQSISVPPPPPPLLTDSTRQPVDSLPDGPLCKTIYTSSNYYYYKVRCSWQDTVTGRCGRTRDTILGYGSDLDIQKDMKDCGWFLPSKKGKWNHVLCPVHRPRSFNG